MKADPQRGFTELRVGTIIAEILKIHKKSHKRVSWCMRDQIQMKAHSLAYSKISKSALYSPGLIWGGQLAHQHRGFFLSRTCWVFVTDPPTNKKCHLGYQKFWFVCSMTEFSWNCNKNHLMLTMLKLYTVGKSDIITLCFYSLPKFSLWSLETTVCNRWLIGSVICLYYSTSPDFFGGGGASLGILDMNLLINHVIILKQKIHNCIIGSWRCNYTTSSQVPTS